LGRRRQRRRRRRRRRRFAVGDDVIGLRDLLFAFPDAHAEYVVLHEGTVAHAPAGISQQP
jgi:NADPH:quinone reductase-like Zn-dependent oxidoreductase